MLSIWKWWAIFILQVSLHVSNAVWKKTVSCISSLCHKKTLEIIIMFVLIW